MNLLTHQDLSELSEMTERPSVSLYLPTHRHHPENQQDPIRYRGLLKTIAKALSSHPASDNAGQLMEPLEKLTLDLAFWNHTLDGLAVFAAPGFFKIIALQRPVRELAVVADSFHTKPLRRFLQTSDRYQILALSRQEIKFYEGSRDSLDAVELAPGVARTMTDALGDELTEAHQTVASYGGVGGASTAMHHGHGGKNDEVEKDVGRFFRAVDRSVYEHHSRPSGLPLILAALPEHHHLFHQVSRNPQLVADGIRINPGSISLEDLRQQAWTVCDPQYRARLQGFADDFAIAASKGLGLDDLNKVAEAVAAGRVATLLIEADREIAGRIHPGSGKLDFSDSGSPLEEDLLDDLGEAVIKSGGIVFVVPKEQMPSTTGAAANCRF